MKNIRTRAFHLALFLLALVLLAAVLSCTGGAAPSSATIATLTTEAATTRAGGGNGGGNGGRTATSMASVESFGPDPATAGVTWTLPADASDLRLSLPGSISDIFYGGEIGVTGFGVHAGEHIEGLDHVWIELPANVAVKSWADGTVERVDWAGDQGHVGDMNYGEYQISINYGHNLTGRHMEVAQPYVKKGDWVKRGQPVAMGMQKQGNKGETLSSAEFYLADAGRHAGVLADSGRGVAVSPFDYLAEPEKTEFIEAYKSNFLAKTTPDPNISMHPYQPYLTNEIMLHNGNRGRLTGEWYLNGKWQMGYPPDIITFIEADNPFYKGNWVLTIDEGSNGQPDSQSSLDGSFEADYAAGHVKMTTFAGTVYYALFSVDESGATPSLTIEYARDGYPKAFTEKVLHYVAKPAMSRRLGASKLGFIDMPN